LDVDATDTRTERTVEEAPATGSVLAIRVVSYILGVIEVILALRFILALLGANRANDFANFVFSVSQPLVQPFFSLFGYRPHYGASKLEMYTWVAMIVYAIIAWGIISLIRLPRGEDEA
jgi:hypothetical protein